MVAMTTYWSPTTLKGVVLTFPHATEEIAAKVAAEYDPRDVDAGRDYSGSDGERRYQHALWLWRRSKELAATK